METRPDMEKSIEPTSDIALSAASITPPRCRLEDTRSSITHKFSVSGHEGYIIAGLYENGKPGEVFIKMAKQGSTLGGLVDTIGILTSLCLQYGVPLESMADKLRHTKFEPSGHTKNPEIPIATSLSDYIFRWLDITFSDEPETKTNSAD